MIRKAIFWDLDGTLTDPGLGITNSAMYALRKYGIEEKRENLYRFIGPPLVDSFMDFYGFDKEEAIKAMGYYREYFGVDGLFENEVYPGIPELLADLRAAGVRLFVATSKPTEYTLRILEKFDLLQYFEYVSGAKMDETNSAKSVIIKSALEMGGLEPSEVIMVGDRKHDVLGANANGMETIGVAYGYGGYDELRQAGACHIVNSVEELRNYIMR